MPVNAAPITKNCELFRQFVTLNLEVHMRESTHETIRAILDADLTVQPDRRELVLQACHSMKVRSEKVSKKVVQAELQICGKSVERLVRNGVLHQIKLSQRLIRYDLGEVMKLKHEGVI